MQTETVIIIDCLLAGLGVKVYEAAFGNARDQIVFNKTDIDYYVVLKLIFGPDVLAAERKNRDYAAKNFLLLLKRDNRQILPVRRNARSKDISLCRVPFVQAPSAIIKDSDDTFILARRLADRDPGSFVNGGVDQLPIAPVRKKKFILVKNDKRGAANIIGGHGVLARGYCRRICREVLAADLSAVGAVDCCVRCGYNNKSTFERGIYVAGLGFEAEIARDTPGTRVISQQGKHKDQYGGRGKQNNEGDAKNSPLSGAPRTFSGPPGPGALDRHFIYCRRSVLVIHTSYS